MKKNPWYKFDVTKLSSDNQWYKWKAIHTEGKTKVVCINEKWEIMPAGEVIMGANK